MILDKKYYLPKKPTKHWFSSNGFLYSKIFSTDDDDIYYHRFTVWRFGTAAAIECELKININTSEVTIDCYDYDTRYKYASFYDRRYGTSDVVSHIDERILERINELGVKCK